MKKKNRARTKNLIWIYAFLLPILTVFVTFYLVPIITVFVTSFTRWDGFNSPVFIGFDNYINLFQQDNFQRSLWNLLRWGFIAGTLHVGFGTLVAFLLYKKPFGGRFVKAVFMIPNVISIAAWALIYKFIFNNDFGILNNLIRIVNPDFQADWFFQSPYAFWAITFIWLFYAVIVTLVVLSDLMAIPKELHESARIDGAKEWQIALRINLPLCRNAIGTSVIMSVTARIGMYEGIALTTRGGPGDDTMNIPLILVNSITDMNYGYANASAAVMIALGVIALLGINRLFRMNQSNY